MKMCSLQTWPCATQCKSPRKQCLQKRKRGLPAPSPRLLPRKTFLTVLEHSHHLPLTCILIRIMGFFQVGCASPHLSVGMQEPRLQGWSAPWEPCSGLGHHVVSLCPCLQTHRTKLWNHMKNLQNWPKPERSLRNERKTPISWFCFCFFKWAQNSVSQRTGKVCLSLIFLKEKKNACLQFNFASYPRLQVITGHDNKNNSLSVGFFILFCCAVFFFKRTFTEWYLVNIFLSLKIKE